MNKSKNFDPRTHLMIRGARQHNLANVDLVIPKKKLVVFTGPSGSGKSSLAFDTIYAEGRRRYIESLSIYARQFLGVVEKPEFDQVLGLSPTISIEQKTSSHNRRSTVGTITEIYDHLRVLYAQLGEQRCHKCGSPVEATTIASIVEDILLLDTGTKFILMAPIVQNRKGEFRDLFEKLRSSGFARARIDGDLVSLDAVEKLEKQKKHDIDIVVDRLVSKKGITARLTDAVERAVTAGQGRCVLVVPEQKGYEEPYERLYSRTRTCATCGTAFDLLTHQSFSFNSPMGMCKSCRGLGTREHIQPNFLVTDPTKSIAQGAIAAIGKTPEDRPKSFPAGHEVDPIWERLEKQQKAKKIRLDVAWHELKKKERTFVLDGHIDKKNPFGGVVMLLEKAYKKANRTAAVDHFREFIELQECEKCDGTRLKPESRSVQFKDLPIAEFCAMNVDDAKQKIAKIKLKGREKKIGNELLGEIVERLTFLCDVGLGYLSLSRSADTLSGGEAQRIRLASQLGTQLRGVLYVLDEPSIGLHQRDNHKLLHSLEGLRDRGNSVIVVEHDRDTMEIADFVVDFGPGAGAKGGEIVAKGTPKQIAKSKHSITGKFLSGKLSIPIPEERRDSDQFLSIRGATHHNLKGIDVDIPLRRFVCITGVSGAGKSSLVNDIVYPAIARQVYYKHRTVGNVTSIDGIEHFDKVIEIDQSPIGRTPRSNPATYTKLFDHIRDLFSMLPESKMYGFKKGRFSFNVAGGRCEECKGAGQKKVEMNFLADVYVPCELCGGKRFNHTTLMVRYRDKNISEVLDLSIGEAFEFFSAHPKIKRILGTMVDVGLDYVKLGQSSTTLSGGEAQRIKLSRELSKIATGDTLYILDEPSTGLHFEDITRLLNVVYRLVDAGNTVLMIEHNIEIIACADYVIDLGPEGGDGGGDLIASGTPEQVAKVKKSYTGQFLKTYLANR